MAARTYGRDDEFDAYEPPPDTVPAATANGEEGFGFEDEAFPLLAPGKYPARILEQERKNDKAGRPALNVKFELVGANRGRHLYWWVGLTTFVRERWYPLALATELPITTDKAGKPTVLPRHIPLMLGKPVTVTIGHEVAKAGKRAGQTVEVVLGVEKRATVDLDEAAGDDGVPF